MTYSHITFSIARCTLHNDGLMGNRLRKTLVEQDHDVRWIFVSTSCEIECHDLHRHRGLWHIKKCCSTPWEPPFGMVMILLQSACLSRMLVLKYRCCLILLLQQIVLSDPVKVVIGSHSAMFVKRKVTPHDEELSTIFPSPFVLHQTNKVFCVMTGWFLKRFLLVYAGDLRLLTHRFPSRIRGRLPCFTLSHTPLRIQCATSLASLADAVEWPTCCTYGVYPGKRLASGSWWARSEYNHYFICQVQILMATINYRLFTINCWLVRSWSYRQLVDDQKTLNSFLSITSSKRSKTLARLSAVRLGGDTGAFSSRDAGNLLCSMLVRAEVVNSNANPKVGNNVRTHSLSDTVPLLCPLAKSAIMGIVQEPLLSR